MIESTGRERKRSGDENRESRIVISATRAPCTRHVRRSEGKRKRRIKEEERKEKKRRFVDRNESMRSRVVSYYGANEYTLFIDDGTTINRGARSRPRGAVKREKKEGEKETGISTLFRIFQFAEGMSKRQWEHHSGQLGIIKRNNKQLNFLEQILSLLIKLVYRLPIVLPIGGLFIEETESRHRVSVPRRHGRFPTREG